MATNINTAFNDFLSNYVNLASEKSKGARKSRNWLVDKIKDFPSTDSNFPNLYNDKNIFFGSFDRKTKKRPLDDLDLMICLSGDRAFYTEYSDRIEITVPEDSTKLYSLCFDDSDKLSSRKVINKFISLIKQIPQYEKSEIKRNYEAATLKLNSYEWNFDVVPCFFTTEDAFGKTCYIIPDGKGNWKKTDPRIDRQRTTTVNQKHEGNILQLVRIIKYWNKRPTMPSLPSYLLETMILNYYENGHNGSASSYVDLEIPNIFEYIKNNIFSSVQDPKEIQGNINTLTDDEQVKIFLRCDSDMEKAKNAREYENNDDNKSCINKWGEIFGSEFPTYG